MIGGPQTHQRSSGDPRGQSLVEFGLILPLLMILLLGIADLGRVFAAAITAETAARNASEAAAQEYLQLDQQDGNRDGSLVAQDYQMLHDLALAVACREADRLPDRIVDAQGDCQMPIIAVCVHDAARGDGSCPETSATYDTVDCDQMPGDWTTLQEAPASTPYIEVRICYRFDLLIGAPLGDWGSIWLQRENHFTVQSY